MEDKIHFYGWQRVKQEITDIAQKNNIIIIDYVDNYFLNLNTEIITNKWYGIIHHTNSDFSGNNIENLFKYIKFIKSLETCQGLIVLSEYNKNNICKELAKLSLDVDVIVLKHPIPPIIDDKFSLNLFENKLQVYNIGGWYRNAYTIYKSKILYNNIELTKHKLKGYHMEQYFPDRWINYKNIIDNIDKIKSNIFSYANMAYNQVYEHYIHICRPNNYLNYYLKHLFEYISELYYNKDSDYYMNNNKLLEHIEDNHNSVVVKEYLDNPEYLEMLKSSIIFCEYIDCSASNTIVECISTGTPIILNYHDAIKEYLGDDYPLYFHKIYDNVNKIYNLTTENIIEAHNYLLEIKNKGELDLNNLVEKLNKIII